MIQPETTEGFQRYSKRRREERVRQWWSIGDGTVHLPLDEKRGLEAIIDQDDVEKAAQFSWHIRTQYGKQVYVEANVPPVLQGLWGRTTSLHRVVLNAVLGMPHVDHRNQDGLDCRKDNLRFATTIQNASNRVRANPTGYRGVQMRGKKWGARIQVNKHSQWLGLYDSAEAAAKAYNDAAIKEYGEFAVLNTIPECRSS